MNDDDDDDRGDDNGSGPTHSVPQVYSLVFGLGFFVAPKSHAMSHSPQDVCASAHYARLPYPDGRCTCSKWGLPLEKEILKPRLEREGASSNNLVGYGPSWMNRENRNVFCLRPRASAPRFVCVGKRTHGNGSSVF